MTGVQLRLSGVCTHFCLGIGNRLHDSLRRIYCKIRHAHPAVVTIMVFKVSMQAMNGTMGENGLVPTKLMFRGLPRFPIMGIDSRTQKERTKVLKRTKAEVNTIVTEKRSQNTLNHFLFPEAYRS